ncbi:MAG TPA: hypothetical protein VFC18_12495 [Burkholderiales bacterium]|nr:hypothetical protein [Burkholderiales bacterium]
MRKGIVMLALAAWVGAAGQALAQPSDQQMASVRSGMTPAEVRQILGEPDGGTATYGRGAQAETVTSWLLPTRGRVRAEYFNVHYRDGKVVRTSRNAEYPAG